MSLSTAGQVTGPLRVGPLGAGFYSGYMGLIPAEWQAKFGGPALTGNADLGIISRTSYGPAASAFDPSNISGTGAQPLVYYPEAHQTLGPWGGANQFYGGADTMRGIVFPSGTSTVLFFGKHGGTFCYGVGTSNQSLDGKPSGNGVDPYCYDPDDGGKGVHGLSIQSVCVGVRRQRPGSGPQRTETTLGCNGRTRSGPSRGWALRSVELPTIRRPNGST